MLYHRLLRQVDRGGVGGLMLLLLLLLLLLRLWLLLTLRVAGCRGVATGRLLSIPGNKAS